MLKWRHYYEFFNTNEVELIDLDLLRKSIHQSQSLYLFEDHYWSNNGCLKTWYFIGFCPLVIFFYFRKKSLRFFFDFMKWKNQFLFTRIDVWNLSVNDANFIRLKTFIMLILTRSSYCIFITKHFQKMSPSIVSMTSQSN